MTWLVQHLESFANKGAVIDQCNEFTYSQLIEQIEIFKSQLDVKIADNQVIAILADYNFYSVALFLALLQKKCVIIPIVSLNPEEIDKRLKVVDCDHVVKLKESHLLVDSQSFKQKHKMIQLLVGSNNAGLVLFSSGSTGEPKAMIHNLDNLVDSYQGKKSKNINMLVFLMFDHIGGINTLLNTLAMGARIIFPVSREPKYIAGLIEKYHVHVLPASPTFLNMMLMEKVQEKYNLSSLKMISYGTEPMPESLLKKLKEVFPKTKLLQTYGTSETGIAQTSSRSSGSLEIKLDGPGLDYKIVENELWLKSKTQVMGYLNAEMDCFTEDGWFKTGDLVESYEDGYIRIKGRNKEVINVGGEKVLPTEIESVILELDVVDDCLVYGEKNIITGQMVAVQLVLAPGVDKKDAKKQVRKYCKEVLEAYKVPAKFDFVETTNVNSRFKKKRIL